MTNDVRNMSDEHLLDRCACEVDAETSQDLWDELSCRLKVMRELCEVASAVGFDGVGDSVPYADQQRFGKAERAYRAMKEEKDA